MCWDGDSAWIWLWPPRDLHYGPKTVQDGLNSEERWEVLREEIRDAVRNVADGELEGIEAIAKDVASSEDRRKETLENKASALLTGSGVALTITSVVPTFFTDKLPWFFPFALLVSAFYLAAVIYLLFAAQYAVRTRAVAPLSSFGTDTFIEHARADRGNRRERIVSVVAATKWNEPVLTSKANTLSVAEHLFTHGLVCLTIASVLAVVSVAANGVSRSQTSGGSSTVPTPSVMPSATPLGVPGQAASVTR